MTPPSTSPAPPSTISGTLAIFIGPQPSPPDALTEDPDTPSVAFPIGWRTSFTSVVVRSAASTLTRPDSSPSAFASNVYEPGSTPNSVVTRSAGTGVPSIVTTRP